MLTTPTDHWSVNAHMSSGSEGDEKVPKPWEALHLCSGGGVWHERGAECGTQVAHVLVAIGSQTTRLAQYAALVVGLKVSIQAGIAGWQERQCYHQEAPTSTAYQK